MSVAIHIASTLEAKGLKGNDRRGREETFGRDIESTSPENARGEEGGCREVGR